MKRLSTRLILFTVAHVFVYVLVSTLLTVFSPSKVLAANGSTGYVSGTVWVDANENGIHEPLEDGVANATVFAQSMITSEIGTTTTDSSGNYVVDNLPYGLYVVWSEDESGHTTANFVAEVNEVTGSLDLRFVPGDFEGPPKRNGVLCIYLALVRN